jgi:uncharacterized membrane protein YfcA
MKKNLKIANIVGSFCFAILCFSSYAHDNIALAFFVAYFGWAAWWGVQSRLEASLQKWHSEKNLVSLYDFPIGIILGFVTGFLGPGVIKFIRYVRQA